YWEDGKLVGFNTGKINRQLTERTGQGYGSLDLIVLHPEARRKGAGVGLSLAALEWLRDPKIEYVACRTMVSNYPATALLQTLGFR
ncbi:MAG: GNAT family N-acetyltransferase, partial [Candidatus Aenigmarchaeota archaeon]|nr:GNAT family N-acetyltransferase [Candidatus Aenigmarchaeota archaeon]